MSCTSVIAIVCFLTVVYCVEVPVRVDYGLHLSMVITERELGRRGEKESVCGAVSCHMCLKRQKDRSERNTVVIQSIKEDRHTDKKEERKRHRYNKHTNKETIKSFKDKNIQTNPKIHK